MFLIRSVCCIIFHRNSLYKAFQCYWQYNIYYIVNSEDNPEKPNDSLTVKWLIISDCLIQSSVASPPTSPDINFMSHPSHDSMSISLEVASIILLNSWSTTKNTAKYFFWGSLIASIGQNQNKFPSKYTSSWVCFVSAGTSSKRFVLRFIIIRVKK